MPNRMEIELTSARDDETYTWRAAGARQPRGVVPVSVLPPDSKVGDVLRAEVEVELDGITVVAILPPKQRQENAASRIEYLGPPRHEPGVTTVLAGRRGRLGRGHEGERPAEEDRGRRREHAGRADRERAAGRTGKGGSPGEDRRRRALEARPAERGAARPGRPSPSRGDGTRERGRPGERDGSAGRPGGRRLTPRFEPGTAHRDQLFASLAPEQRRIAERLAAGGMPAVRKAIADEQERARAEGRTVVSGEPIVAVAEQLLPEVKAAVWLDRAEAAAGRAEEISLRDLRMTVVGAAPRDDAGRELERRLREVLERRVTKLRTEWEEHISSALSAGKVLQALRLSAKPPEPTARFPAALVMGLAEAAGQAMTAETPPERWLSLLHAAAESPVRRQVKPTGMPKDPSGQVEREARLAASRVPALARLLGMAIPPPPPPRPAGGRPVPRPPLPARPESAPATGNGAALAGTGSEDSVVAKEGAETGDEP
ncbi:MAG TPA: hypothetical protein VKU92_07435 [Acidimicrobiales bacterium]|nr:hypothetical protein [Acidimicrobiales bacterium]